MLEFLRTLSAEVLLGLFAILGLVVVITLSVFVSQWRKARTDKLHANLKRDLLARGLSVDEVERLTTPAGVQEARIAADSKVQQAQIAAEMEVKEAQIAADLKRDMLARGLSVADIERLIAGKDVAEGRRAQEEAGTLAVTIANMVHDGELDPGAVAALLKMFLKKIAGKDEAEGCRAEEEANNLAIVIANMVQEGELDHDAVTLLLAMILKKEEAAAVRGEPSQHARQLAGGA